MVVRSDRPERALQLAEKAHAENDKELLDRIPEIIEQEGGQYTFVGYLGTDRATGRSAACNAQGIELGPVEPGDSFISKRPRPPRHERRAQAARERKA